MNENVELIKTKEINFLKELDNSVIRFRHSLPHHNDNLLNKVLVEKFIAQSKIDFYDEYKSLSSQYNYIYTKNKLVEERCDEIIRIFQDMENDMKFLDDSIKNSGDIERGFNFRFYLKKIAESYKFSMDNSKDIDKKSKRAHLKSKNKREFIISEYSKDRVYLNSVKRSLKQVYKKKINTEVKKLSRDLYDLRKNMKVNPKDYDTRFKLMYLIPGVGQLQFNQLYKFLIMIGIFLVGVFVLIGDFKIDKVDEFVIAVLVVLEIINIINYKKIVSNINKGIRPNNFRESIINIKLKIRRFFVDNTKLIYWILCGIIGAFNIFIVISTIIGEDLTFVLKNYDRFYMHFDVKIVIACVLLSVMVFSIAEIVSLIVWRIFSRVDKELNLLMCVLSILSLFVLLIFPNDFLFTKIFGLFDQYVLHDQSLMLIFWLTFWLLIDAITAFNVYSMQKIGFFSNNINYLMHNDDMNKFEYYRWVVFPIYSNKINLITILLNFMAFYVMFCFSGVYFDHMIDIYNENAMDVLVFYIRRLDSNYYYVIGFIIVAIFSIINLCWDIITKIRVRR
ncbi:hypothetical protein [Finegoldia magna]|uniref:hypothetical protein n=1 Tax=Finegoldia magna TaxID=1260 RepID=UPI00290799EB|nr:hypothetical protein [Finegoldia magna]MDU7165963.1 hypothetical protein [Finegoldia magna]